MTASIGLIFALISAVTQAGAHALLASGSDKLVVRGIIGFSGLIAVMPLTMFVPPPTNELWFWLLGSGALHAMYQLVLVKAYEGEDFSVAYPLARGVAPLAIGILGTLVLEDQLSLPVLLAILLVSFGLIIIASTKRPSCRGISAAIAAGLMTTAYTLLDAHAVRISPLLWTFVVWFFVVDGLFMSTIVLVARRSALLGRIHQNLAPGLMAGAASLVTYATALIALRLIPAGSASGLRETSVVFGAAIAFWFLKEDLGLRRIVGTACVFVGGCMVAIWSI